MKRDNILTSSLDKFRSKNLTISNNCNLECLETKIDSVSNLKLSNLTYKGIDNYKSNNKFELNLSQDIFDNNNTIPNVNLSSNFINDINITNYNDECMSFDKTNYNNNYLLDENILHIKKQHYFIDYMNNWLNKKSENRLQKAVITNFIDCNKKLQDNKTYTIYKQLINNNFNSYKYYNKFEVHNLHKKHLIKSKWIYLRNYIFKELLFNDVDNYVFHKCFLKNYKNSNQNYSKTLIENYFKMSLNEIYDDILLDNFKCSCNFKYYKDNFNNINKNNIDICLFINNIINLVKSSSNNIDTTIIFNKDDNNSNYNNINSLINSNSFYNKIKYTNIYSNSELNNVICYIINKYNIINNYQEIIEYIKLKELYNKKSFDKYNIPFEQNLELNLLYLYIRKYFLHLYLTRKYKNSRKNISFLLYTSKEIYYMFDLHNYYRLSKNISISAFLENSKFCINNCKKNSKNSIEFSKNINGKSNNSNINKLVFTAYSSKIYYAHLNLDQLIESILRRKTRLKNKQGN